MLCIVVAVVCVCMVQAVVHILGQQQGLPVNFLCRMIADSAWNKYVITQKTERGAIKKVPVLVGLLVDTCVYIRMCVHTL